MPRFSFATLIFRKRHVLAVPMLLAFAAPAVYGQGRSMRPRPNMMPSMMHSRMPARTPAMTPSMMTQSTTNALLRRDIRLDSLLLRDLRSDHFRRPFWSNQWWGMGGGGLWGWGGYATPLSVSETSTSAVAQKPTADPEQSARAALVEEQVIAERLANRRRAFDELQYERDKAPTPEQELLNRSRTNPPPFEVLSGQAL